MSAHQPAPPGRPAIAAPRRPPSIATRLARAILSWTLVAGLAVIAAVWLAATHEVDELLDDTLQSSADVLAVLAVEQAEAGGPAAVAGLRDVMQVERFAWQLVTRDGQLLLRSARAPVEVWHAAPRAGFADLPGWRTFGLATGQEGRMLYAAQTREERDEARGEVAVSAVLAALAVGLLGQLWLRARVRHELQPLKRLSAQLAAWRLEDGPPAAVLGPPQRAELAPVHESVGLLAERLASRLAHEQAFSAHAAHALRTPLAGIDAQLAVAVREAPAPLAARLVRVRGAAARLQHVVAALLGLFRSADGTASLQRGPLPLAELLPRLPHTGLQITSAGEAAVDADADLLLAALLNLLDNAQRHGAREVRLVGLPGGRGLRVEDDGEGLPAARREALAEALAEARYADAGGLGLMLADRVARAHGGRVLLPAAERGFVVEMQLGALEHA